MDRALVEVIKREWKDALFSILGRFPEVRHAATTTTWRWPTRCATAAAALGERPARPTTARRAAPSATSRPSSCSGPHLGNNLLNLGIAGRGAAGHARARARPRRAARRRRRSRASATAASAGSPPATWTRWRRSQIPAIGYGIRYEFGIFDQAIRDGWQVEMTDKWLRLGNPWEIARPGDRLRRSSAATPRLPATSDGRYRVRWVPERVVRGVAYDTPILGYRVRHRQPAAAVEGRGRRVVRLRRPSTPATTTAPSTQKVALGEHHQGALPERRARCRASGCGSSSSTSSSPARCRT